MHGVLPPEIISVMSTVWTEPFWAAAREHRLVIPRCGACGEFRFPPTPFCPSCSSQAVDWVEHDGAGTIYSFTVVRHAVIPDVRAALPLIAAVVELPGTNGCRLIGNVVDADPADVAIGQAVTLDWYDVDPLDESGTDPDGEPGTSIPVFRLA